MTVSSSSTSTSEKVQMVSPSTCTEHAQLVVKIDNMVQATTRQSEQLRTVFKSLDKLTGQVENLPDKLVDSLTRHEDKCPARVRVMRKATGNGNNASKDSGKDIDVSALRTQIKDEITQDIDEAELYRVLVDEIKSRSKGMYIPRWVIWTGTGVGAAIVAILAWIVKAFM